MQAVCNFAVSRRGYVLVKSKRRDPFALDYGYSITNQAGKVIASKRRGLSLDDVEAFARKTEES